MLKLPHNCTHLKASKVMLKILTETEDIKKRWQEYIEELYKKDLHDPDNNDGVIARYPEMWSQVGLRKHHYEQS